MFLVCQLDVYIVYTFIVLINFDIILNNKLFQVTHGSHSIMR